MDLVHFEQLVMGLMDPSNQIRSQAEKTYNDAKAQPDILISLLLQSICQSQVEQVSFLNTKKDSNSKLHNKNL